MALYKSELRDSENHRDGHYAHQFEAGPEIGREISPDDFVQNGEKNEKARPSECQQAPAFIGQVEDLAEQVTKKRVAGEQSTEQDRGEQEIHDRWFDLDEELFLQIERQRTEDEDEHA